jgi:hypothetical protein
MIDLEEMLNCKDCRIKDTCRIFTVVKELYCISDLENCVPECEKKEKLVFKICKVCGKNMSKGLDGAGTITHECVYCGHKFVEEKGG